ncbi:MAG TPA: hypothetical protein PLM53_02660 [Spirochaetota bacterium]|nr:hypothetical protein [Spirochaetota bacterium]HPC41779.1 hypothetical protein [Spirochaetota bacterium]HPL16551.1 hypothetical protein [Spirochaetota bacterium]HQF06622.1 hypothetical protein [Spirochaetota bacterium]HQH95975.1 hypothetical protein [Spirochaetota bacterium]
MAKENIQDKRFPFLHSHIAREPHIYEVLNEIMVFQNNVLNTGIGHLITIEDLKTSRNIKIPFTIARNKLILNLIDILLKNYPDEIRMIITFSFLVDPDSKKLTINENREFTVLMSNDDFNRIQSERNRVSCDNFLSLISQFRLFNLTKLLKKTKERALLSQVIKMELGKSVFTYKNYSMNRQNMEIAEDYCFHHDNYDAVRKTLTLEKINKVIMNHSAPILRRLKNFGILNTEFSDYTDTKLDYLLNILLQDLYLSLSDNELTEVKNFNSLRSCILKVESVIDPIITAGTDIVAYIRENRICSAAAISSVFNQLPEDRLLDWVHENGAQQKILSFRDEDNIHYIIDGTFLLPRLSELHDLIMYKQDDLLEKSHSEREKIFDEMHLLCNAGKNLLLSEERSKGILESAERIQKMHQIIEEYDNYQNSFSKETAIEREEREARKRRSILEAISDFFRSLFAPKKEEPAAPGSFERESDYDQPELYRPAATGEAKSIIYKIKNSSARLIVLSNYIDLLPANESDIEMIINDIRRLNLKIVIPIYNARKVLYPNRSQLYLIPDMEYLMVNPEVIQSPETIREFTDSLAGEKIKDEKISGQAILSIEKYLMSIHSQKKAQMLKKTKSRK